MREAVYKNKIASIRLMPHSKLAETRVVCIKGKKEHWWSPFKAVDTIVNHRGTRKTLTELTKELGPIHLYIKGKEVWMRPQVVVQYQYTPWHGACNSYAFDTNQEAVEYYEGLINENGMEEIK